MMTKIREKTHILLYILVFCFIALIVVEWGAKYSDVSHTRRGVIGKINGDEVRYADFVPAYNGQISQMREQKGESPSESEMENVSDQIWNQVVDEMLLRNSIKDNHVLVGDSEVVFMLRNSPPDFLKNNQAFQTDGKFDENKYVQALSNPQYAHEWAQIENLIRNQLPFSKLQYLISNTARVSESELRQEYARRNLKLQGKLVYFSPSDIPIKDVSVSDDELEEYYKAHLDEYKAAEKARLAYISFSDAATKEDSAEVLDRMVEVKKQIDEGKDFAELAKIYSTEPGAAKSGGSLGWFTRGRMVHEFEEACFKAKKGDIVGPIQTQFGYHIIKIEDTRFVKDKKKQPIKKNVKDKDTKETEQDSVMASHILFKMEASAKTVETARDNANQFYELAKDKGFAEAFQKYAGRYKLTIDTTAEITSNPNGLLAGFPDRMRGVVRFAFNEDQKIGAVYKPAKTAYGFTLFQLVAHDAAGIPSFEAVKERVKNAVQDEKRKQLALKKAKDIRAKINSIDEIRLIDTTIQIHDLNNFTMTGTIPGVGRDTKLNWQLFQVQLNILNEPILASRGAYLVQIMKRDEFNEARYQEARADLKRQITSQKQQRAYRDWLEATKKQGKIEDFRTDFNL